MGDILIFEGRKWCGLTPLVVQVLELEAMTDTKRLALDEGVAEEEPEFRETTLATYQKKREPVCQEAILLLMRWTKDDLAVFMVLEQVLRDRIKEVLECWV